MAFVASRIWPQSSFHLGFPYSTYFSLIHSGLHVGALFSLLIEFLLHWARSWQEACGILKLDPLMSFCSLFTKVRVQFRECTRHSAVLWPNDISERLPPSGLKEQEDLLRIIPWEGPPDSYSNALTTRQGVKGLTIPAILSIRPQNFC